jgi:hypothetical protein
MLQARSLAAGLDYVPHNILRDAIPPYVAGTSSGRQGDAGGYVLKFSDLHSEIEGSPDPSVEVAVGGTIDLTLGAKLHYFFVALPSQNGTHLAPPSAEISYFKV